MIDLTEDVRIRIPIIGRDGSPSHCVVVYPSMLNPVFDEALIEFYDSRSTLGTIPTQTRARVRLCRAHVINIEGLPLDDERDLSNEISEEEAKRIMTEKFGPEAGKRVRSWRDMIPMNICTSSVLCLEERRGTMEQTVQGESNGT